MLKHFFHKTVPKLDLLSNAKHKKINSQPMLVAFWANPQFPLLSAVLNPINLCQLQFHLANWWCVHNANMTHFVGKIIASTHSIGSLSRNLSV
jgi:hypothetical protein